MKSTITMMTAITTNLTTTTTLTAIGAAMLKGIANSKAKAHKANRTKAVKANADRKVAKAEARKALADKLAARAARSAERRAIAEAGKAMATKANKTTLAKKAMKVMANLVKAVNAVLTARAKLAKLAEGIKAEALLAKLMPRQIKALGCDVTGATHDAKDAAMAFIDEELYNALVGNGVNRNHALAIAFDMSKSELAKAVAFNKADALTAIKGIGKISARKIIAAMQGKLKVENEIPDMPVVTDMVRVAKFSLNEKFVAGGKEHVWTTETVRMREGDVYAELRRRHPDMVGPMFVEFDQTMIRNVGNTEAQVFVDTIRENAVCGIALKGMKFVLFQHGTNAARKCTVQYIREELLEEALDYTHNGANLNAPATPAKFCGYGGLSAVATVSFGVHILPEQIAIFPSFKEMIADNTVFVNDDGSVNDPEIREFEANRTDGISFFDYNDEALKVWLSGRNDDEIRNILKGLHRLTDRTIRGPLMKGLMVTTFKVHAWLKAHGIKQMRTVTGEMVDVDKIVLFCDETVFKCKFGPGKEFETKADFDTNFARLNREVRGLVNSHSDTLHSGCYQMLQPIVGASGSDVNTAISEEVEYLNSFTKPVNAAKLLGGEMTQLAHIVPSIMENRWDPDTRTGDRWFADRIQDGYLKKYREAIGARLHNFAHFSFGAPDPIAVFEAWCGMEVNGCIDDHNVLVVGGIEGQTLPADAVAARIPCTDLGGLVEMKVIDEQSLGDDRRFFDEGSTYFFSCKDNAVNRMRGDWDGDHFYLVFKKWYVDAVRRSHETFGDYFIDWNAPAGVKVDCAANNFAAVKEYVAELIESAKIGQYSTLLAKLYDNKRTDGSRCADIYAVAIMTYAINVLVDAAKHGGREIELPKEIASIAKAKKNPLYVALAKDAKCHDDYGINQKNAETAYGSGVASYVSNGIRTKASETLTVENSGEQFDVRSILFGEYGDLGVAMGELRRKFAHVEQLSVFRKFYSDTVFTDKEHGHRAMPVEELFDAVGKHVASLSAFESNRAKTGDANIVDQWDKAIWGEQGVFQLLCFANSNEWKALTADDKVDMNDVRACQRAKSLSILGSFCVGTEATLEDVYDYCTISMFARNDSYFMNPKHPGRAVCKDICWDGWSKIFGGMAVQAALSKVGKTFVDVEYEAEELDCDEDELFF